jgi:hypothetical protein
MDGIVCCSKSRSGAPREPTLSSATRHPPARFDSLADRGKRKPAESRHRVDRRDLPGERKIVAAHAGGSAGVGAVLLTNADNGQMLLRTFMRRLLEVVFDG